MPASRSRVRAVLRDCGLSLALFILFVASLVGQIVAGRRAYENELQGEQRDAGSGAPPRPVVPLGTYLASGHFIEALFENWESEFLQMGVFVILTIKLRQRGSSESKKCDEENEVDEDPRTRRDDPDAPWPVRRGGWVLALYEHSLSSALFTMFAGSFLLHAWGGLRAENMERALRGEPPSSMSEVLSSSELWFQSLQNWQSEFLSIFVLIVISIFLRERGSSQSKRVAAPHGETGE